MIVTIRNIIDTGTFTSPTFRAYSVTRKVFCSRIDKLGNLFYLYNSGGYVVGVVAPNELINVEE